MSGRDCHVCRHSIEEHLSGQCQTWIGGGTCGCQSPVPQIIALQRELAAKDAEIEAWRSHYEATQANWDLCLTERDDLREENEALKKEVASAKILNTIPMSEIARYQRELHFQRQENEALKRQRDEWKGYCTGMQEEIRAAQAERDAAIHYREDLKRHLGNLLAVIHQDGGHHQSTHGDVASSRDAETTFLALLQENEILRRQRDEWMKISHAWEDDVTKLREENETNRKNFIAALNAASDLAINGILAEVTRLRLENEALKLHKVEYEEMLVKNANKIVDTMTENEDLKQERAEIAEELGHYRAVQEIDPSSDAFLDTCEDLETLRASAQSLIFTTRTLQKRAERERDEFKKAFTQADKDAINALWNFDPEIPYTAGGFGPGFVIDIFRTHLQVAWATIAELKQDQLETRDLLETHRLRIEAHMNTVAEQAKLIEQARKVFGIIPRELMQVVGPPYQMKFTPDGFRVFCDAARALEAKDKNASLL